VNKIQETIDIFPAIFTFHNNFISVRQRNLRSTFFTVDFFLPQITQISADFLNALIAFREQGSRNN
jgi:hypothetical protein